MIVILISPADMLFSLLISEVQNYELINAQHNWPAVRWTHPMIGSFSVQRGQQYGWGSHETPLHAILTRFYIGFILR